MTVHFVQLTLGNKTYVDKVSTEGCTDVADFIKAIRASPQLPMGKGIITLFQPDGTTQILPQTSVDDLKEVHLKLMVVTVEEFPTQGRITSSKKQPSYNGESIATACSSYLNYLSSELCMYYDFPLAGNSYLPFSPTIGDLLQAVEQKTWEYKTRNTSLAERINDAGYLEPPEKVVRLPIPLPEIFDQNEWRRIEELNTKATELMHNATLPKEQRKSFAINPILNLVKRDNVC